jgi:hypothetical protein
MDAVAIWTDVFQAQIWERVAKDTSARLRRDGFPYPPSARTKTDHISPSASGR